jgi:antitoxin component YwqK of YwqJK toxin-antitoxin module
MTKKNLILILLIFNFITACSQAQKTYYPSGSLHEEKILKSIHHLSYREYYENGNIKEKTEFIDGLQDGIGFWYDKNGNIYIKASYVKGIQNGLCEEYYPNGNLKSKVNYKNDKKEGISFFYYEDGNLYSKENYNNDNLNGISENYFPNGNLKSKVNYKNGKEQGLAIWYFEKGTISSKVNYINDIQNGIREDYFPNGNLKSKVNYKNDKKQGLAIWYFENGGVSAKENYVEDIKDGNSKNYFPNGKLSINRLFENDSIIYYQKYDSLGNKLKEYRKIKIIPGKEVYKIGEKFKASIVISGPKNYKTSKIVVFFTRDFCENSKAFDNLSEIIYEPRNTFYKSGYGVLIINTWVDKTLYYNHYTIKITN